MRSLFPRVVLAGVWMAVLGFGCGRNSESSTTAAEVHSPVGVEHAFPIRVGDETVQMRLAVRPHEQQRGLMFVKSMPEDSGMLFVYQEPQRMSFWMRNTYIPLDIGYFDADGELREVRVMYPHIEDPVQSAAEDLQFALEMNKGWFAEHGVVPGAKLDLEALEEALAARGFDAGKYVAGAAR